MIDPARLDALIQRKLDDELTADERAELAAAVAADPAARRRHDEFVALEDLLFVVGSSDRSVDSGEPDPALAAASSMPVPTEEEFASSGAWLPSLVGAAVLAAIIWLVPPQEGPRPDGGVTDGSVPDGSVPVPVHTHAPLQVASVSEGWLAVPVETDDPGVQFVWLCSIDDPEPVEGTNR